MPREDNNTCFEDNGYKIHQARCLRCGYILLADEPGVLIAYLVGLEQSDVQDAICIFVAWVKTAAEILKGERGGDE